MQTLIVEMWEFLTVDSGSVHNFRYNLLYTL